MFKKSATRTVTVLNPAGLHARPSLAIVQAVRRFQSHVEIRNQGQTADAASILDLLALGAACGTELLLSATGPDADDVLDTLAGLFATRFGLPVEP